jgi:hypothetical protein
MIVTVVFEVSKPVKALLHGRSGGPKRNVHLRREEYEP